MKSSLGKKVAITTITIVVIALLATAGFFIVVMINKKEVDISVDDLAEMKTLAHEYLNERSRLLITSTPENNPKIAGAPVIDPSDMSPELAERQKVDVEKLKAIRYENAGVGDDFATYLCVRDIREEDGKIIVYFRSSIFCHLVQAVPEDYVPYWGEGYDFYATYTSKANRWILDDVKLPMVGTMPPAMEPSVEPSEGGEYVPDKKIPEKIQNLDREATLQIVNEWAIDEKTSDAIEDGTYSWN